MFTSAISGVDAYSEACRRRPLLVEDGPARRRVDLYGWRTGPTREVHIARAEEPVLSIHLGGARRVRVFTEGGLSRTFSKPGDVTLVPSGKAVSYRTEGEVEFATLHFSPGGLRDEVGCVLSRVKACLFALPDTYITASVRTLMDVVHSPARASEAYVSAIFEALAQRVAHVVDAHEARGASLVQLSQPSGQNPAFERVLEQIEANLAEKLTLNHLADTAGVCRSTFAEQFAKRFGCSPHKFIVQRRIERAKALLVEGRLSITDIAYEAGFSGQSHFSTTFRTMTGQSPSEFCRASPEAS